jgi:hypothetical protein
MAIGVSHLTGVDASVEQALSIQQYSALKLHVIYGRKYV